MVQLESNDLLSRRGLASFSRAAQRLATRYRRLDVHHRADIRLGKRLFLRQARLSPVYYQQGRLKSAH